MVGYEMFDLFNDTILRDYLWRMSHAFSKNPDHQRKLYITAWLKIDECLAGKTTEFYMHRGFMAMNEYYKEQIRSRVYRPPYQSWDCAARRVRETITPKVVKNQGPNDLYTHEGK